MTYSRTRLAWVDAGVGEENRQVAVAIVGYKGQVWRWLLAYSMLNSILKMQIRGAYFCDVYLQG